MKYDLGRYFIYLPPPPTALTLLVDASLFELILNNAHCKMLILSIMSELNIQNEITALNMSF